MVSIQNIVSSATISLSLLLLVSATPHSQGGSSRLVRRLPESIPAAFVLSYGRLEGRSPKDSYENDDYDVDDVDEGNGDFLDSGLEGLTSGECPEPDQYVCPDDIHCCKSGYSCGSSNSEVCVRDSTSSSDSGRPKVHSKIIKTAGIVAGGVVLVILIVGITTFCCVCRAGGKFYRKKKLAAKPSPIAPAAYIGGGYTHSAQVAMTQHQATEPLNHPNQPYYQDQLQTQQPFSPHTAFQQHSKTSAYPQHAPPPPSPQHFYTSQTHSPYGQPAPPYSQDHQSHPLLSSGGAPVPSKGGKKSKNHGNAAHVDVSGFNMSF